MRPIKKRTYQKRRAAALVASMIFVLIFSALAVSMATLSGANVQLASNHQSANAALAAAQSGQEVIRYWLSRQLISSSLPVSGYEAAIIKAVQDDLKDNSISNIVLNDAGSIAKVTLDSTSQLSFDANLHIDPCQPTILRSRVTGHSGDMARDITILYNIQPYEFPIFNFGLATKGPLNFPGNPTITAVNSAWEADMFVESSGNPLAVQVLGNTNFDGDVNIGNAGATAIFGGDVQIAGDYGQTAVDNHIEIGMDSPEFPAPDTDGFLKYATGGYLDPAADLSKAIMLTNKIIKGGMNPVFNGTVTIEGILFIESPNKVTFNSNVALKGIIVADGDIQNPDPGSRRIDILGNFASQPYPSGIEFDDLRNDEVGSSLVAPGFFVTFGGNFSTLEGVVAVSGVHFAGNVNAQIKGTIINYSNSPTIIEGNATMNFDREGSTKIPAGFDLYRELDYEPSSYSETST